MKTRHWYIGLTIVYVAMIVLVIYDTFKGAYYFESWFQGACIGALAVGLGYVIISWIQYEKKAKIRRKIINEWAANKKVLMQKAAVDSMEPVEWDETWIRSHYADSREYLHIDPLKTTMYYKNIPLVERLEQIRDKQDISALQELIDELKKVGG